MSYLIIARERYALQMGDTTLGGDADELLALSPLAALPPFAVITSGVDEGATIRALPGTPPVQLSGKPLPSTATELRHGDRLTIGDTVILYGDVRAAGRTSPVHGITDDEVKLLEEMSRDDATAPTGGRLVALDNGATRPVPDEGLVIGRDPECGLVIGSNDVSRRHAVLAPGILGYTLTDESINGVFVNGARVDRSTLLRQRDVIRIGDAEFRFEADDAEFEPARAIRPVEVPTPRAGSAAPAADAPTPALLATLEVITRGVDEGKRFRIERPSVQIGRGTHNDVRIADESVSGSHATLMHRGATWYLLDLSSRNGSYVDGARVTEQPLSNVCELRFGNVKLVFRAISAAAAAESATRGVVGIPDAQLRNRQSR
jgi:pSer/pThr/pTyr-binding forkhead associated (FHA) protein